MSSFWCSKNEIVEYNGIAKTSWQWVIDKKLSWETVKKRVQRGSSWREALELSADDLKPRQHSLFQKKRVYKKSKVFVHGYYLKDKVNYP